MAQTYNVTDGNDDGTGGTVNTLSWAILQANNNNGGTIDIQVTDVTMSGSLLAMQTSSTITITGNLAVIHAGGFQAFTVFTGNAVINNLTVTGALSQGAAGGNGNGGGGGGLGAGGGLYIDQFATATINNVVFQNNQAQGGAGGMGDGSSANGGDGAGYNANSNSPGAGTGGATGGPGDGANGGYGGGGAGSGASGTTGGAGNGGGNGGAPGVGGGGGLALGGAVFVGNGGTLTIINSTNIDNTNTVTGGAGGTGTAANGAAGSPNGGGMYVGIGSNADFDNSAGNITISGDIYSNGQINISGSGASIVSFEGTTINSGLSTGTVVNSGTLSGTTNSLQGTLTNSGNIQFLQSTTGTFNGTINGVGSVTLAGTGTVIFVQANSYTGGTFINAGTLSGTTVGIQGNITDNSNLVFNQNFDGTYAGNISGNGNVLFQGTGRVTMTGTNNTTGNTTISSGTYVVNGSSSSATTVNSGGTLAGTGTINADVTNSGNLAPGNNGIGTLTVNGNFTSNPGSTTSIEINNAGNVPGVNNDLLKVNGNLVINGGNVVVLGNSGIFTAGTRYTFIQYSGTRTGAFDGITTNMTFYGANLVYDNGIVAFDLFRNATTYGSVAQTLNQYGVANYLDQHSQMATGSFATLLDQINQLSPAAARNAFQMLEGEIYATTTQLSIQNTTYMYQLLRRGVGGGGFVGSGPMLSSMPMAGGRVLAQSPDNDKESEIVPVSFQSPSQRPVSVSDGPIGDDSCGTQPVFKRVQRRCDTWTGWAAGYGLGGDAGGDGNASGGTYGIGGTIVALDRSVCDRVRFGVFGAYNYLSLALANPAQRNNGNDGQFGTYLRGSYDRGYFLVAGAVGFDGYNSRRNISFGNINNVATAAYNGWQASSYAETGLNVPCWFVDFQPFVGLQYIYLRQNSLAETGAPGANLNVAGTDAFSLRNLLGTSMTWDWWGDRGRYKPELRAVWLHEYLGPETSLNSTFQGLAGGGFVTQGLNFGRDWALLGGGLTCNLTDRSSLSANYDLQVNSRQTFHVGSGAYHYRW